MSSNYVFDPHPVPAVPVHGSQQLYPVRRIFCVGRNYAAHAREMGGNPDREPPFFFAKNPVHLAVVHPDGSTRIPYPPGTSDLHHEVELVVAIGQPAFRITPEQAVACIWGHACGIDLTRRDLQAQAKDKRQPWTFAKNFEHAAVIGPLVPVADTGPLTRGAIRLSVNDQPRQHGDLSDMIWSLPEVISRLSHFYQLQPGDLIYTGTPEGVGPLQPGDWVSVWIDKLPHLELHLADKLV